MRTSSIDAFGPGLGLGHEFGLAMGDEHITPAMLKDAVSNPIRKASVGAALRGEASGSEVTLEMLVVREMEYVGRLCAMTGYTPPSEDVIMTELETAQTKSGGLTVNDRFRPKGLTLDIIFAAFYAGNSTVDLSVRLYHTQGQEWWPNRQVGQTPPHRAGHHPVRLRGCDAADGLGRPAVQPEQGRSG